jgi:tetratricopeptide (TPR) repeat protein
LLSGAEEETAAFGRHSLIKRYRMRTILTTVLFLTGFISFGQNFTIEDLSKLYNSRDYKSVIEIAKPLLDNEPNNMDLNLLIGRAYTGMLNYEDALPYLEFTVANDKDNSWRKAWALGDLGTCFFMLQKFQESKESLEECIKLNATKNSRNDAFGKYLLFGFSEFYSSWKIVETDSFRFHFQKMTDPEIEKYISVKEKAFKEINVFFRSSLPGRIDYFVWNSREDAKRIAGWNLGFARPDFCIVHTYFQQTVGHEMTHVISHYSSNFSDKTRFINEGTSVCFDQTRQDRLKQIKDWMAVNNKQISIKDYWEHGDTYPEEILYPVSGLFVKDMITHFGRDQFMVFFSKQTYENAKTVFGDELDNLIQEFENKMNL